MEGRLSATGQVVQGIQFKVLGHAFPVLRHDAIKPISNAKLATAMMSQKAARPDPAFEERSRELLADVDMLLDESVEVLRSLDAWLRDDAGFIGLDQVLNESRKLVFTHLLMSGKKIRLARLPEPLQVAQFPARYVLLAWLLHAVDEMPPGAELLLESPRAGLIQGTLSQASGAAQDKSQHYGSDPVQWREVEHLALFYGWHVERDANGWRAQAPEVAAAAA